MDVQRFRNKAFCYASENVWFGYKNIDTIDPCRKNKLWSQSTRNVLPSETYTCLWEEPLNTWERERKLYVVQWQPNLTFKLNWTLWKVIPQSRVLAILYSNSFKIKPLQFHNEGKTKKNEKKNYRSAF